jgi:hypothetical protein
MVKYSLGPPPPLPPHSAHGSVLLILLEICLIFTALPVKLENGYISNVDQKPELRIRIHLIRIQLLGLHKRRQSYIRNWIRIPNTDPESLT